MSVTPSKSGLTNTSIPDAQQTQSYLYIYILGYLNAIHFKYQAESTSGNLEGLFAAAEHLGSMLSIKKSYMGRLNTENEDPDVHALLTWYAFLYRFILFS